MVALVDGMALQLCLSFFLLLAAVYRKALGRQTTRLISRILHVYLCHRNPIEHHQDKTSLPTSQYQWPNGQGDTAKFLDGDQNSDRWAKEFGRIYRIWSGMKPEMYGPSPFLPLSVVSRLCHQGSALILVCTAVF